ncbi:MAG: hypothetical protein ABIR59_12480 [Gemmatimonadales bacterium]
MGSPGYVYLINRANEHGDWFKVGVAARIGRVNDHRGWDMAVRTFESDHVLADAGTLEKSILDQFPDRGSSTSHCGQCGAKKPPIGRGGSDGLTEIRHAACHPGLRERFELMWTNAPRLLRDEAWRVTFDAASIEPGGFQLVGAPWRQPPNMDAPEYQQNTCNVICVRDEDHASVVAFLDAEWERGTVNLRAALWTKYGTNVCKVDGTPTPRAKGTGVVGTEEAVNARLTAMAAFPDVGIVLVSVRKPGTLYAYVRQPLS